MKNLLLLFTILLLGCQQSKQAYDVKAEEAAVRAVLEAEQIAWNNGDIEKFMEGYWKSDSLQFMSNRGINKGWQETFDGYKRGYPDRESMGTLRFEIIKVTPIDPIHFVVSGKYFVTRLGGNLDGSFTLIFKKIEGKWVAIYDHTS